MKRFNRSVQTSGRKSLQSSTSRQKKYLFAIQSSLDGAMKTAIFHGKLDVSNNDESLAFEVMVLKAQRK